MKRFALVLVLVSILFSSAVLAEQDLSLGMPREEFDRWLEEREIVPSFTSEYEVSFSTESYESLIYFDDESGNVNWIWWNIFAKTDAEYIFDRVDWTLTCEDLCAELDRIGAGYDLFFDGSGSSVYVDGYAYGQFATISYSFLPDGSLEMITLEDEDDASALSWAAALTGEYGSPDACLPLADEQNGICLDLSESLFWSTETESIFLEHINSIITVENENGSEMVYESDLTVTLQPLE